jgi:hypothetical protein
MVCVFSLKDIRKENIQRGKVKCIDTFFLISVEFLRSHLLLLRMVLVFLPIQPRWLRPGAPLVGPICNL